MRARVASGCQALATGLLAYTGTVTAMAFSVTAGDVFDNRYRLLALIGTGPDARVFAAGDLTLNRRVTIKIFDDELSADDAFVEHFEQVAAAAVALAHPHVVATYDWGCVPVCYLVTEHLTGGSLRSMLDAGHRLSRAQALVVGLQTARALKHIHSKGLTHHGIKPSNLLFDADGRIRLCDLGLEPVLNAVGRAVATAYVTPEQSRGEPSTSASDVYRLALVMGEAVTGESPLPVSADPSESGDLSESKSETDTALSPKARRESRTPDSTEAADSDDPQTLIPYTDTKFGFSAALGPLWYVVGRATETSPEDRPTAAVLVTNLLDAAELLSRPEPMPIVGVRPLDLDQPDSAPHTSASEAIGRASWQESATGSRSAGSRSAGSRLSVSPPKSKSASTTELTSATLTTGTLGQPSPRTPDLNAGAAQSERWSIPLDDPPRRRWPGLVLSVLLVIAAAVTGGWLWLDSRDEASRVPDLIGESPASAASAVAPRGWKVEEVLVREAGSEPGRIVKTDPSAGDKLADDATLTVFVSLGEPLVAVPDLYALTIADATSVAMGLGLEVVGETPANDEQIPVGFTVGVDVPAGVYELEVGAGVRLLVSAGPADVTVPSVPASRSVIAAQQELLDANLVPGEILEEFSLTVDKGLVIAFSPASGEVVPPDSRVYLIISQGRSLVEVPNVVGLTVAEAVDLLQTVNFDVQLIDGDDTLPVTSTDPPPGELVPLGSEVLVSTDQ